MIRIAVCDDNTDFLHMVADTVKEWSELNEVLIEIYTFDNGDALLAKHAVMKMDIVFLDIIMPLQTGIKIAKELRCCDNAIKIVFLTSSPEFALESYEVKAYGYLLKPVSVKRIREVLDDICLSFDTEPQNTVLKTTSGYQKIYFHDIEYAEAQNKRVVIYLRSGKVIYAVEPLYLLEEIFTEDDRFFKCHRSYLVYMPNVDHFDTSEIHLQSGRSVPIARGYAKAFKEAYFSMMFRE